MLTRTDLGMIFILGVVLAFIAGFVERLIKKVADGAFRGHDVQRGMPVAESEGGKLWTQLMTHGCLDCGTRDDFREGPNGGLSTNIFCARCGAGYNITPALEIAERIGRNPAYIDPAYSPSREADAEMRRAIDRQPGNGG
jgi:hypothetical protein